MLAGSYQENDGLETAAVSPSKDDKPVKCGAAISACCAESKTACPAALFSSFQNRYLFANVVYFIYATGILYIDLVAWPNAWTDDDVANVNRLYLGFGCLHMVNALLYVWSWLPLGFGLCSWVMIPEYLNILSAILYIWTATLYAQEGTGTIVYNDDYYKYYYSYLYDDPVTWKVHHAETAAAAVEMFAAFGWVCTWWLTYPRYPGRGWTFDDPDSWANLLIVGPSITYFAYNCIILAHPEQYATNDLYVKADIAYWIGAWTYLAAALRDDGWFFWLPTGGQCAYGLDTQTPMDPLGTGNLYDNQPQTTAAAVSTGSAKDVESGASTSSGPRKANPVGPGVRTSSVGGALGAAAVAGISGAGWLAAGVMAVVRVPANWVRHWSGRSEKQSLIGR